MKNPTRPQNVLSSRNTGSCIEIAVFCAFQITLVTWPIRNWRTPTTRVSQRKWRVCCRTSSHRAYINHDIRLTNPKTSTNCQSTGSCGVDHHTSAGVPPLLRSRTTLSFQPSDLSGNGFTSARGLGHRH